MIRAIFTFPAHLTDPLSRRLPPRHSFAIKQRLTVPLSPHGIEQELCQFYKNKRVSKLLYNNELESKVFYEKTPQKIEYDLAYLFL
jgi:hypothetical protein